MPNLPIVNSALRLIPAELPVQLKAPQVQLPASVSHLKFSVPAPKVTTVFPSYIPESISVKEDKIYFTEVKYRRNDAMGGGLVAVDKKKMRQMKYAAECFMKYHAQEMVDYNPLLAVADVQGENFEVKDWFTLD